MTKRHFMAVSLAVCFAIMLAMMFTFSMQVSEGNISALLVLLALVVLAGLALMIGNLGRSMYGALLKEQSNLRRQIQENHLVSEKLEFDSKDAIEKRWTMSKELKNKDLILKRLAQVLEANMRAQISNFKKFNDLNINSTNIDSHISDSFSSVSERTAALEDHNERSVQMLKYAKDLDVLASLEMLDLNGHSLESHFDAMIDQSIRELGDVLESFNVQLVVENDEEQILIQASETQLMNLLNRLFESAIRLSHEKKIKVKVISYHDASIGDSVRLDIMVKGRGLTEQEQQELFTQYLKISDVDGKDISPGLSPVIAYNLATQLGGQLSQNSVYGHHTEFVLLLPLKSDSDT